ncbi:hypothetical protein D9758_014669 [Tetrapyrgos nigripes]|uniref:DDE Tnp4 domain-containing protein n=1 Tax=Tetrapyrgos nigripes TaxID=182062 RepID=A0A8H5CUN3_9AGAR|nr:hypothetical protein D9758_014669 [Tetrapyrgos nigripes]
MDDLDDALLLLQLSEDNTRYREEESTQHVLILATAYIYYGALESQRIRSERRLERRLYLTRPYLLPNPRSQTPWQVLYEGRNDRAFITTMGLNVAVFQRILDSGFERYWNENTITRQDVPAVSEPGVYHRSLDAAGALGLLLHYLNSTMCDVSLMQIFPLIPTTVSQYLNFGRHPLLTGAFGSIDGLKLPVQTSSDEEIENATYNGWLHEHYISNVLCFSPEGVIIACRLNAPGSWHDSRVAHSIYNKLLTRTPEGYYLIADMAFPRGTDQIAGCICAPIKEGTRLPADPIECSNLILVNQQLLSFRQTAEWGMRSIQGSFGRLHIPLDVNDDAGRADLLELCFRLHNLRTQTVGYNQIRSVYLEIWQANEQEQVWNEFENMVFGEQRRNDRVRKFYMVEEDI